MPTLVFTLTASTERKHMFDDSCLSNEEQELRDQKFLEGLVTVRRDDATLHAAVVSDWEAKYPLETIAERNACDVPRVRFELNVEAQMRAWHG
jgi:hypothetical protein